MKKTVVGLFDRPQDAGQGVAGLRELGVHDADIGVMTRDNRESVDQDAVDTTVMENMALGGAALGGLTGLLAGLGALGSLVIPGIGPVLAVGTLTGVFTGTTIGAGLGVAAGGLIGFFIDAGLSEEEAQFYANGISHGNILVSATVPDSMAGEVQDVLQRAHARAVNTLRVAEGHERQTPPELQ